MNQTDLRRHRACLIGQYHARRTFINNPAHSRYWFNWIKDMSNQDLDFIDAYQNAGRPGDLLLEDSCIGIEAREAVERLRQAFAQIGETLQQSFGPALHDFLERWRRFEADAEREFEKQAREELAAFLLFRLHLPIFVAAKLSTNCSKKLLPAYLKVWYLETFEDAQYVFGEWLIARAESLVALGKQLKGEQYDR